MMASIRSAILLTLLLPGCGGGSSEPASVGHANQSDGESGADASDARPAADGDSGSCFCCSGSRGIVPLDQVGDVDDCSWCPMTSQCIHFVGGGFGGSPPPNNPDFVCATTVPDGGTAGPGASTCP